jgi:hypothetical protein
MCAHQVGSYVAFVTRNDSPNPPKSGSPVGADHTAPHYEIRVKGHLTPRWAAWFDGLSLTADDDGTTAIRGPVVDQAALHGLLQKLRDAGIALVSLTEIPDAPTTEGPEPRTNERN